MDLITPSIGLIFWQSILFILLFFFLSKFAWKPIFRLIENREKYLKNSLQMAQKIKEEMNLIEFEKKKLMERTRIKSDYLLKETDILSKKIIKQARENAENERKKLLLETKQFIENQKQKILLDIKNQVVDISINIAEKIIKKELKNNKEQKKFISNLLTDFKNFS